MLHQGGLCISIDFFIWQAGTVRSLEASCAITPDWALFSVNTGVVGPGNEVSGIAAFSINL